MTRLDMVRQALAIMGDVSGHELAAFIEREYGELIQPVFIPVIKATLQNERMLAHFRAAAKEVLARAAAATQESSKAQADRAV